MKLPLQVLKDEFAPALALLAVVMDKYGAEGIGWDPAILRAEIERDFGVSLSDLQSDKIQAAILVSQGGGFENDWQAFETCCHLFNHQADDMDTLDPLEAEELIMGVTEATLIRHDRFDYSEEVNAYAGRVFHDYGLFNAPAAFPTAIMPLGEVELGSEEHKAIEAEKNDALRELVDAKIQYIIDYIESMEPLENGKKTSLNSEDREDLYTS